MMFVGYILACIAASLVLALGTLTPQWDDLFSSLGLQSPKCSRRHCGRWSASARSSSCRRLFAGAAGDRHYRRLCLALGRRLRRDRRRAGAGAGLRHRFRRLSSRRPMSTSRASAKCSPRPASPAAWSIGCSPAGGPVVEDDPAASDVDRMNRTGLIIALDDRLCGRRDLRGRSAARSRYCRRCSSIRTRHLFAVNAQLWVQHTREAARVIITLLVAAGLPRHHRQADLAAAAHADRRPRRAVPDRDAGARPRPSHQRRSSRIIGAGRVRSTCTNSAATIASCRGGIRAAIARTIARSSPASRPARSGRWRPRRWRRRNCSRSPMARRSPSASASARCASAAARHFFTDVVFAGVFMYLLIWLVHGLIYRWPATRIDEAAAERRLAEAGEALAALARRLDQPKRARPPERYSQRLRRPRPRRL